MARLHLVFTISLFAAGSAFADCGEMASGVDFVLVRGVGGAPEYDAAFGEWTRAWETIGTQADMHVEVIGPGRSDRPDRELLHEALDRLAAESDRPICLVLIGHGTFFLDQAKFNVAGPDFTARELNDWLAPIQRPVAIINCASCSGAFIDRLSAPNRVIVTATRSGSERNYARFGKHLSAAVGQLATDIDHDGAITLLEAFLKASRDTQAFYEDEGRLATEHALLDDNGDRTGTPADFFRGIHVVKAPKTDQAVDGLRAHQWILATLSDEPPLSADKLALRDELERKIEALRRQKQSLPEDDYYAQLETLLVRLARLYPPEPTAEAEPTW